MLIEHVLETLGNYLSSPFFINESINKSSISGKAYQPLKMRDNLDNKCFWNVLNKYFFLHSISCFFL